MVDEEPPRLLRVARSVQLRLRRPAGATRARGSQMARHDRVGSRAVLVDRSGQILARARLAWRAAPAASARRAFFRALSPAAESANCRRRTILPRTQITSRRHIRHIISISFDIYIRSQPPG
jgi:hypothetical protein